MESIIANSRHYLHGPNGALKGESKLIGEKTALKSRNVYCAPICVERCCIYKARLKLVQICARTLR